MLALQHRFTATGVFCEGEEPEVSISNSMFYKRKIASDDDITIYVPRAFQRSAARPLILQHVRAAQLLVRPGRFRAIFDIRICRSSYKDLLSYISYSI